MNTLRRCVLVASLAAIALGVVHIRTEQSRCAAQVMATEGKWLALRVDLGDLQARKARLRTPDRLRNRNYFFDTGLVPPGESKESPVDKLASTKTPTSH